MLQLFKEKQKMDPQLKTWQLQGNQNIRALYYMEQTTISHQQGGRQKRAPPETTTATVEQETQFIESVDFTTSTWTNELHDKLDETLNKLNATIAANKTKWKTISIAIYTINSN